MRHLLQEREGAQEEFQTGVDFCHNVLLALQQELTFQALDSDSLRLHQPTEFVFPYFLAKVMVLVLTQGPRSFPYWKALMPIARLKHPEGLIQQHWTHLPRLDAKSLELAVVVMVIVLDDFRPFQNEIEKIQSGLKSNKKEEGSSYLTTHHVLIKLRYVLRFCSCDRHEDTGV